MKSAGIRMICRLLVVTLVMLQFQAVQAGMIGTDQVAAAASAQVDRNIVLSALNRSDVASQLQSMGVDPKSAQDRVASLTNEEVRTLAGQLNSLPAGAMSNWGWVLLIVIGVVIYFNWKR